MRVLPLSASTSQQKLQQPYQQASAFIPTASNVISKKLYIQLLFLIFLPTNYLINITTVVTKTVTPINFVYLSALEP